VSEGFTICTHRHPCPRTSHRIRENSQEIEETLSQGKKERNLQESNRGGSLSRMDRSKRCHVYRRNHYFLVAAEGNMGFQHNSKQL